MTSKKYAIYPPIGIARIGNAPEEYFIANEIPGKVPAPGTKFKDKERRIKRQAARFRVYELDENGKAVKEITSSAGTSITWEVHLANRKGVTYQFKNAMDLGDLSFASRKRNESVTGDDREQLIIDGGRIEISSGGGKHGAEYKFAKGFFFDKRVTLGEIRTDQEGRLIVLGGLGKSESLDGTPPKTFANNDGWYDDTSDGTVRATVTIDGEEYKDVEPAMVAVCPPNYGQGLFGVVTMYDVVYDMFCRDEKFDFSCPEKPNFYEHIFPIFDRLVKSKWVNEGIYFLFGEGSPSNFSKLLKDPSKVSKELRETIFAWFRDPDVPLSKPTAIPPFYGDGFSEHLDAGIVGLSVTRTQYEWLKKWKEGHFELEPMPSYKDLGEIKEAEEQVQALTRAHLEDCLGGPFHPGIELTWTMRHASMLKDPFRLNILDPGVHPKDDFGPVLTPEVAVGKDGKDGVVGASGPGSLTRWLGVPWQTDEASCMSGYTLGSYLSVPSFWAARVPNQVLSELSYERVKDDKLSPRQRQKHFDYRQKWLRSFSNQYLSRINSMVENWHQVGIVSPQKKPVDVTDDGDIVSPQEEPEETKDKKAEMWWVESENHYDASFRGDATYQQLLIAENIKPESDLSLLDTAAVQLSGEVESVTDRTQRRVLGRDEM